MCFCLWMTHAIEAPSSRLHKKLPFLVSPLTNKCLTTPANLLLLLLLLPLLLLL